MRRLGCVLVGAAVASSVSCTAGTSRAVRVDRFAFNQTVLSAGSPPRLSGHALLVNKPGLRAYGPGLHATTPCPRLLPLPAHALRTVKRAVQLAMPPFEKPVHLDGRDAVVTVAPDNRSAFNYRAGGCGRTAWARSVFAEVYLPHVTDSASLSQHRFAVGRVRQGWVIWGYIH